MSDIWGLSDGGSAADGGTEYELPGGNIEVIPDGSSVLALIDEAKWDNKDGAEYISLRWTVLKPEELKNRKVFQKLWVTDDNPAAKDANDAAKKRDRSRRMLAVIDANAGGKLVQAGMPTDDTLTMHLTNKPMVIRVAVWSMPDRDKPGQMIEGNWVQAVGPKDKELHDAQAKPKPQPQTNTNGNAGGAAMDDEIPF